jgi:hypothetical protein
MNFANDLIDNEKSGVGKPDSLVSGVEGGI